MRYECPKCGKKFYSIPGMRICEHESLKPVKLKRPEIETKLVLKEKYQELSDEFESHYEDMGCSCHINPPCGYCTHPGNPICLESEGDVWERVPVE